MSYILEALKKAQAERQIGSTPSIHAPTLASAPAGQGTRSNRTPVIVAMALMAAAIAGLATMLVRQQPAASLPPANIAPAAATPAAAATTGASPAPAAIAAASATITVKAPSAPTAADTAPAALEAGPIAAPAKPTIRAADARLAQAAVSEQAPGQRNGEARAAQHAPAPAAPATVQPPLPPAAPAPAEEQVQSLRELPEPIQRAIPQITLGGYMYSKNPADRLLLIDKVLRKEGEEVAPGLILDKLQPKQAIFSFRGYRYRVPL